MVKGDMLCDAPVWKKHGQLDMESVKNFVTDHREETQTFHLITCYLL